MVNVRPITVVRCPDRETVTRVISALGKKAERLSDNLVALHATRLTPAERAKLQDQGVLITKDDIVIKAASTATAKSATEAKTTPATDDETDTTPKKRGRPKKKR